MKGDLFDGAVLALTTSAGRRTCRRAGRAAPEAAEDLTGGDLSGGGLPGVGNI
ncbi:MAG: hypothetical protein ACLUHL_11300 [Dysosmobacter welbionis]